MDKEKHILKHKELHKRLDELVADFIGQTKKSLVETSLMAFIMWSADQTANPTEMDG